MITIDYFNKHFGKVLKTFAAECGCEPVYEEVEGECNSIKLEWTTDKGLAGRVLIVLYDEGFDISQWVEGQPIQLGRTKSWNTPPSNMLARLRQAKRSADAPTAAGMAQR